MRDYNPAIIAYRNMDIENMPADDEKPAVTTGLLAPRKNMKAKSGKIDINNPNIRMAKHMKIIRDKRNDINGV